MNELIKSVHELACMRYSEVPSANIGVILKPYTREEGPTTPMDGEVANICMWIAQVYMGKGRWGSIAGEGNTPQEALTSLHDGMVDAHKAVDERRDKILNMASTIPTK